MVMQFVGNLAYHSFYLLLTYHVAESLTICFLGPIYKLFYLFLLTQKKGGKTIEILGKKTTKTSDSATFGGKQK